MKRLYWKEYHLIKLMQMLQNNNLEGCDDSVQIWCLNVVLFLNRKKIGLKKKLCHLYIFEPRRRSSFWWASLTGSTLAAPYIHVHQPGITTSSTPAAPYKHVHQPGIMTDSTPAVPYRHVCTSARYNDWFNTGSTIQTCTSARYNDRFNTGSTIQTCTSARYNDPFNTSNTIQTCTGDFMNLVPSATWALMDR